LHHSLLHVGYVSRHFCLHFIFVRFGTVVLVLSSSPVTVIFIVPIQFSFFCVFLVLVLVRCERIAHFSVLVFVLIQENNIAADSTERHIISCTNVQNPTSLSWCWSSNKNDSYSSAVKVNVKYYWDMLLSQQMLAAIIHIADDCKQPLNKVVEALAPNILVQLLSLLHHGTSLHNTLSICLQFVQLQSNFRQLLTAYIADVAGTFKLLI